MQQPSTPNPATTIALILDRLDRGKQPTGTELRSLRSCFAEVQAGRTSLAADLYWAASRLRSMPTPEDEGVHGVWEIAANTLVEWAADAQFGQLLHVPRIADPATPAVLAEVATERVRQNEKFGEQNHVDGTGPEREILAAWSAASLATYARNNCQRQAEMGIVTWLDILGEEVAEALAESNPEALRAELVQVAAVAVAWIEAIDRRGDGA